jgi:hypothetical protein
MRSFQRQRQRDDDNNSGTTIGNWVRGWIQETWSLERIPISGGYIQMALEMFYCGGPSLMGEEEFLRLPPQLHRVVSSFIWNSGLPERFYAYSLRNRWNDSVVDISA